MAKNKEEKNFENIRLNWYPGHMAKTIKQLEEDMKLVDIVIELLDARIPISSQNPEIKKIIKNKKRIIVLNKSDLADSKENDKWINYFEKKGIPAILCNSNDGNGINKVFYKIKTLVEEEREKAELKGRSKIIRAIIVGIPNVGKSSFINRASNKTSMMVENRPGVTKNKQWIRLKDNIELLDTPGVLWPKIGDKNVGLNLAYTGTIKDNVVDEVEVAYNLIKFIISEYNQNLVQRYGLNEAILEKILNNTDLKENEKIMEIMQYIGEKRGAVIKGNNIDFIKTSRIILEDFRSGNLGNITLEKVK